LALCAQRCDLTQRKQTKQGNKRTTKIHSIQFAMKENQRRKPGLNWRG
jgi:hypothetical protein